MVERLDFTERKILKKFTLLMDMDGVLLDWDAAACKANGVDVEDMNLQRGNGEYWIHRPLGVAKNGKPMTDEEIWKPIARGGVTFWYRINPLPWFDEMIDWVDLMEGFIVSDPRGSINAITGKIESLRKHAPQIPTHRFIPTGHKHLLAKEGVILIDDNEETITKFRAAGGSGILFPTLGNSLFKLRNDPVKYVKKELKGLKAL